MARRRRENESSDEEEEEETRERKISRTGDHPRITDSEQEETTWADLPAEIQHLILSEGFQWPGSLTLRDYVRRWRPLRFHLGRSSWPVLDSLTREMVRLRSVPTHGAAEEDLSVPCVPPHPRGRQERFLPVHQTCEWPNREILTLLYRITTTSESDPDDEDEEENLERSRRQEKEQLRKLPLQLHMVTIRLGTPWSSASLDDGRGAFRSPLKQRVEWAPPEEQDRNYSEFSSILSLYISETTDFRPPNLFGLQDNAFGFLCRCSLFSVVLLDRDERVVLNRRMRLDLAFEMAQRVTIIDVWALFQMFMASALERGEDTAAGAAQEGHPRSALLMPDRVYRIVLAVRRYIGDELGEFTFLLFDDQIPLERRREIALTQLHHMRRPSLDQKSLLCPPADLPLRFDYAWLDYWAFRQHQYNRITHLGLEFSAGVMAMPGHDGIKWADVPEHEVKFRVDWLVTTLVDEVGGRTIDGSWIYDPRVPNPRAVHLWRPPQPVSTLGVSFNPQSTARIVKHVLPHQAGDEISIFKAMSNVPSEFLVRHVFLIPSSDARFFPTVERMWHMVVSD